MGNATKAASAKAEKQAEPRVYTSIEEEQALNPKVQAAVTEAVASNFAYPLRQIPKIADEMPPTGIWETIKAAVRRVFGLNQIYREVYTPRRICGYEASGLVWRSGIAKLIDLGVCQSTFRPPNHEGSRQTDRGWKALMESAQKAIPPEGKKMLALPPNSKQLIGRVDDGTTHSKIELTKANRRYWMNLAPHELVRIRRTLHVKSMER